MKRLLLPLGLAALAITLALIAAARLPAEAQPVIIGVMAGVLASLPTSLIIVWRVTKRTTRPAPVAPQERPPTVIFMPPTAAAAPSAPPAQAAQPAAPPPPTGLELEREPRAFTIIGGQDET